MTATSNSCGMWMKLPSILGLLAWQGEEHELYMEVRETSDHQFTRISVCGSADGVRLPPFILNKGKHLYNTWIQGGPARHATGSVTQDGSKKPILRSGLSCNIIHQSNTFERQGPSCCCLMGIILILACH